MPVGAFQAGNAQRAQEATATPLPQPWAAMTTLTKQAQEVVPNYPLHLLQPSWASCSWFFSAVESTNLKSIQLLHVRRNACLQSVLSEVCS
mmetsp:Transcript_14869/g.35050  ORF Transcript_14869/g.35050 Transcript_14869/m.35050 type:complete len:91 (-) Transcript_14869:208-480(-)